MNKELAVLEPPVVVTTTLAVPAAPAGAVAVMEVLLATLKVVAATPPNVTLVAPVKFVPVRVTAVPPAVGPELGLLPVNESAQRPWTANSSYRRGYRVGGGIDHGDASGAQVRHINEGGGRVAPKGTPKGDGRDRPAAAVSVVHSEYF